MTTMTTKKPGRPKGDPNPVGTTTVRFPPHVLAALRSIQESEGISIRHQMQTAVEEWLTNRIPQQKRRRAS